MHVMTTSMFSKLTAEEKQAYREAAARGGRACRGKKKREAGKLGFKARIKKIRQQLTEAR